MASLSEFAVGESSGTMFTLTTTATNGTVVKNPNQAYYDSASTVQLTAVPATGYHFTGWSGDVAVGHETDNPLTLTMDANKNITANFAINTYTLTVNADPLVGGTVTKDPDHAAYDSSATVQLTADTGNRLSLHRLER